MQMVILKYMSVLCFTLFFGSNKCDQLLMNFDSTPRIQQVAACISRRLTKDHSMSLEMHYTNCSEDGQFPELIRVPRKQNVELLCRNNTNLIFRITDLEISNFPSNTSENEVTEEEGKEHSTSNQPPTIIILKIHKTDEGLSKQYFYLSKGFEINAGNLSENSNYTVSVVAISGNNTISILMNSTEFSTLSDNYQPGNITNITVVRFYQDEDNSYMVKALIEWKPAEDMTCFYDVLTFLVNKITPIPPKEIRQPEELFTCTIDGIFLDSTFRVGIKGLNKYHGTLIESHLDFLFSEAPSCLDWYHNNMTICAPPTPTGLQAYHLHLADNSMYNLNISWDKPDLLPDYYQIDILDVNRRNPNESISVVVNISRDQTSQFFESFKLNGYEYEVHLTAYSVGGNSTAYVTRNIDVSDIAGKIYVRKLLSAIIIPVACIILAALLVLLACHCRAKLKRDQERCKYFEELEKKAPVDPNSNFEFPVKSLSTMTSKERLNLLQQQLESKLYIDDGMEIDRDNIVLLDEILGEGAFGLVRKGMTKLKDGCECEVAIKMLKDNPSIEDIKEFRQEIEVMKSVGKHPNIVGIIGHCTRNISELFLLTEYCSRGNLLHYLRSEWHYQQNKHIIHDNSDNDCPTPMNESVFNFDTSFIDKISISYKNINQPKTVDFIDSPDLTKSHKIDDEKNDDPENEKLQTPHIIVNNAYELSGPCTNSCKCQVDIIPKTECLKIDEDYDVKYNNKIEIKGCRCRVRMLAFNELGSPIAVDNHGYYKLDATLGCSGETIVIEEQQNDRLTSGDLLRMARQIARGMEFLSKNKVVHRDLAARNVLVCENKDVKIADFGLSRDIYQENIYKKTGNGKLPIKWLALESMTHQVYTSQSDVWSYGILLYEIVTLGGTPYPLIPTNRLMKLLKAGYRMEKPKNCSLALYHLMQSCWRTHPSERPTFTEICRTLDELISQEPINEIINLSIMEHIAKRSKSTSEESYLKPI